ncbi:Acyl-CoA synthetase family member 3, mitochondrial [Stylophora pistillata]|uniref:Acyl-CoA synthetase family member 3, mitochondrial n=1 Tax=Stylophora pistillata TaxID=50429 RepID=A0A2B4SPR8_STYPI|nr:Acyl-CoA synthetase family member 3, mitochondrial [Stylophora pistillata]
MWTSFSKFLGKFHRLSPSCCLGNFIKRYISSSRVINNRSEWNSVVFLRAREYKDRVAIVDSNGSHSYEHVLHLSQIIGNKILERIGKRDLSGRCVAFLCPNDVSYVASKWAIWRNGGTAVPLCNSHPASMHDYVIQDCNAELVISSSDYAPKLESIAKGQEVDIMFLTDVNQVLASANQMLSSEELTTVEMTEQCWDKRDAMIVYTSGTTGQPKGVLSTHGNLRSQITALVKAWEWTAADYIIHCLPLHHVHGIVNVLLCPLWVGATCHMLPKFKPDKVWDILTGDEPRPSLFMAVPTIYSKLIEHYEKEKWTEQEKERIRFRCEQLRLMVSGSAALPEPVMKRWKEITGHTLLERYGMTEIGMALSNPLHGPRLAGSVGTPLPGTEVRIVTENVDGEKEVIAAGNEHGSSVSSCNEGREGELQVRGPSVFKCYWNKPDATRETFTEDSWFKTGDTAAYTDRVYSILGRTSVDIIESGGYKISALEVERHLLSHNDIIDCAVLGKPDPVWGERVAAIVTLSPGKVCICNQY